jgi:hypothetical protein
MPANAPRQALSACAWERDRESCAKTFLSRLSANVPAMEKSARPGNSLVAIDLLRFAAAVRVMLRHYFGQ